MNTDERALRLTETFLSDMGKTSDDVATCVRWLGANIRKEMGQAEAAARAEEREAIARMLEKRAYYFEGPIPTKLVPSSTGEPALHICAAAIRARND